MKAFSQTLFQEELAQGFAAIKRRNSGHARRSRGALRRKAVCLLVRRGYTELQARSVVRDAQDYAELLEFDE